MKDRRAIVSGTNSINSAKKKEGGERGGEAQGTGERGGGGGEGGKGGVEAKWWVRWGGEGRQ